MIPRATSTPRPRRGCAGVLKRTDKELGFCAGVSSLVERRRLRLRCCAARPLLGGSDLLPAGRAAAASDTAAGDTAAGGVVEGTAAGDTVTSGAGSAAATMSSGWL